MKYILFLFLHFIIPLTSVGQSNNEDTGAFALYLEAEKIDSIYHAYLKVMETDVNFREALLFRNEYGWALHEVEQLKKDIPAILNLPEYSHEMAYEKIFQPHKFPPGEWPRFLQITTELLNHFENNPVVYREMLGTKTILDYFMQNDSALLLDLPQLIELLEVNSPAFSMALWQHAQLLLRIDSTTQAISVLETGWKETSEPMFLQSLVGLFSSNKEYEKVIALEDQIRLDGSGILFYNLAEAYLNQNDPEKADHYYTLFIQKFILTDYEPFVQIEYDNTVYRLYPEQLEALGDFYVTRVKSNSCEYYHLARQMVIESREDEFFKSDLTRVKDENQKNKMIAVGEKRRKDRNDILQRVEEKLKGCD